MQDRTDPSTWPTARGPWHEVTDLSRRYDFGMWWCACASGHPNPDGEGYPDATVHPFDHCRTAGLYLDDITVNTGRPAGLEVFAAREFSFGELRGGDHLSEAHIVLEFYDEGARPESTRCSLSVGDCLRLARWLSQLVDLVGPTGSLRPSRGAT